MCLQGDALLGKESARPPSLAAQNLQNLLSPPVWCIPPASPRRSPDPPDSWTEPYLSHQGSHLQSQLLVDRKPPCHYLSVSLGGEQQTLSLCLPFDLTPKIQPMGEKKRSQESTGILNRWSCLCICFSWFPKKKLLFLYHLWVCFPLPPENLTKQDTEKIQGHQISQQQ